MRENILVYIFRLRSAVAGRLWCSGRGCEVHGLIVLGVVGLSSRCGWRLCHLENLQQKSLHISGHLDCPNWTTTCSSQGCKTCSVGMLAAITPLLSPNAKSPIVSPVLFVCFSCHLESFKLARPVLHDFLSSILLPNQSRCLVRETSRS